MSVKAVNQCSFFYLRQPVVIVARPVFHAYHKFRGIILSVYAQPDSVISVAVILAVAFTVNLLVSFPVTSTTTLGFVVSVIFVLVSSPYCAPLVNLAYNVSLCFKPPTFPFVPVFPLAALLKLFQLPLFILYWIV